MTHRTEQDAIGVIDVPANHYWGAQTERSRLNFPIGEPGSMPREIIRAYALVKKAAALTNAELGVLAEEKSRLIVQVCDEILAGALADEFPLVIWQTGSGTQTNMNVNEVIARRAHELAGGAMTDPATALHPNDDVNLSQSSNDTFPTAMHVAAYELAVTVTIPGIQRLRDSFAAKAEAFAGVTKIGRTHCMDAAPITLGQEISAYVKQLDNGMRAIRQALEAVAEIALGATAVGTGLNAPPAYADAVAKNLARHSGYPFTSAANKFEAIAAHDALVELSGAFRRVAVSLAKIANDVRLLASGPRCGLGELHLPANEPGSSIMPGKVNPTQAEALLMVATQVMGNDVTVGIAGSRGDFQLNVFKPLIAANVLQSARLLGDACASFSERCIDGLTPNRDVMQAHLENSLMLVTALVPHIGYDAAAAIAKRANADGTTLREAAIAGGTVSAEDFDRWVVPAGMTGSG